MTQQMKYKKTSLETTDDGNEDISQQTQMYAKDSLDRFGDDLCELLLSYLSLEDRFRFECLSKQFQRAVFTSVVNITLSDGFIQRLVTNAKTIDTQLLATIAIKCPNIVIIDCRGMHSFVADIPKALKTFRDNCLHLREIYCNLRQNSGQTMATIGPLVTRINVIGSYSDTQSLTHCHRLSHLSASSLSQVFDTSGQLMTKNLNTFEIQFNSDDDYHRLSAFVAQNESLKCLDVMCVLRVSEETLTALSAQLSRFTQLRQLSLALNITGAQTSLTDTLRTIGVNCKQLQRLSLQLSHTDSHGFNRKTLDSLRFCHRLKRLRLTICVDIDEKLLEPLRHCKRLTHLELYISEMTANVLKDLHIKCPRLQYLCIQDFNNTIDTECLSHISRLPALQMLVIHFDESDAESDNLSDNDFYDLLSRNMAQHMKHLKTSLETTDDGNEDISQQSQIYAKDSLDRFGDDLCALLVSYLSLEDRFRLECVSKQFQRTVFTSVVDITLSDRFMQRLLTKAKTIDTQLLATIAIKCPKIETIDYTSGQPLAKNLHNCELYYYYYNDNQLSAFVAHNQSLRSLDIKYMEYKTNALWMEMCGQLSRLTQLRQLKLGLDLMNDDNSLADFLHTIGVNCGQLKRLSLRLFSRLNETNVQTLHSLQYYRQLKRLDLRFNATADEISLEPLRHCRRLTHLDIYLRGMNANVLTIIRTNCPQLQYLCIHETYCLPHIPTLIDMAQQLTQMMASLETTDGCEDRQQPQIYAKNSMDRFGDDLCELLLSYLSFEDRFQCECVSKQFRRTVFGSVVCIDINDRFIHRLLINNTIDTQLLATIAIKCPNIETIDCRGIWMSENREHIPEMLAIIRDNCLNLREISCNLWQNSGQTMPTIGPLVTRIDVTDDYIDIQLLTHCHRLSHLKVFCLSQVFDTSGQLMAKNLNTFELNNYSADDYYRLSAFVAQNQSLKCLVVKMCKLETYETLTEMCEHLSQLTQLRELRLNIIISTYIKSLDDTLRPIGVNCKQLKRLSLQFCDFSHIYEFNGQTLDSLRYFRRLKRLHLSITPTVNEIVLEPLRHCRRYRVFVTPLKTTGAANACHSMQRR
ncbi:unnamed protein product [Medioppia subpectinata]|uniref:F-box domain-containing protein n=1 Tax=Medioppia subpectinata TaxID=1979941 RepID=A0A7R9KRI5_9ACAR|nr:unnamed protein product [Medioppia subpectinata]CAG2108403.1 unnamed protein product [Medioppia subpectinata]